MKTKTLHQSHARLLFLFPSGIDHQLSILSVSDRRPSDRLSLRCAEQQLHSLLALFWAIGIAGFITGLVALGEHPHDRGRAERGTLVGSIYPGPIVTLITLIALSIPKKKNNYY